MEGAQLHMCCTCGLKSAQCNTHGIYTSDTDSVLAARVEQGEMGGFICMQGKAHFDQLSKAFSQH